MKIGFTGSQGTGKTSLVEHAVNQTFFRRRGFTKTPSTARETLKAGYSINRDADQLSQLVTILARMNKEIELQAKGANLLSDRTLLDSLAYAAYSMNNIWREPNAYYWQQIESLVKSYMPSYDLVVYFPVYWEPKSDGVRDDDPVWQKEIDMFIVSFLEAYKIKHIVCQNESVAGRSYWLEQEIVKRFPQMTYGNRHKESAWWRSSRGITN